MAWKYWWMLALAAALEAAAAAICFAAQMGDQPLHWGRQLNAIADDVMLAAGVCLVASGLGKRAGVGGWLAVHGAALGAVGVIFGGLVHVQRLQFKTVALLFVAMAVSLGVAALQCGRKWNAMGAAFFALAFLAMGMGGPRLDLAFGFRALPDYFWWKADWLWFAVYFAFSAMCLMMMAYQDRPRVERGDGVTLPIVSLG